jgi:hypothetical protein
MDLWPSKIQEVEAIMKKNPFEGCFESHKLVASLYTSYLVLEDDVVPTLAFHDLLKVARLLEEYRDFDIVYLGGLPTWEAKPEKSLYEGKCMGTYAMIVNPRARDMMLNLKFRNKGIDEELTLLPLRTAFCDPPFFVQVNTVSDIGSNSFTKSQLFADLLFVANPIWRKLVIYKNWILLLFFICILSRNRLFK